MNWFERIMLKLGFVSVELYKEREKEGTYFYETLDESMNLLSDIYSGEIENTDKCIVNFLELHATQSA